MPTDLPPPKKPNPAVAWLTTFAIQHGCNLGAIWVLAQALHYGYHRALPIIPTWAVYVAGQWFVSGISHATGYHFSRGQLKSVAENFSQKGQ